MNCHEEKLVLTIPSQHLPFLISLLDVFKGLPFYFEEYSLESVSYLINLFGLSSLSQFICENLPSPQNIGEALDFLAKPSCEYFSNIFDQSLSIVLNHFAEMRIDQFLRLSHSVLEKLLQSPQLQVENEDFLFNLVTE
jgi:hypothetical protein